MKQVSVRKFQHQCRKTKQLFGQAPTVFRNTGLIYSDEIGSTIADMGFKEC